MSSVTNTSEASVFKSISVNASTERAFAIFTAQVDSWWPRGHHIGKAPLEKLVIETRAGGRCYGRSVDGTESDWGRVLIWEPPKRLVLAWQITPEWQYEPDLTKASEVEVSFTPIGDGKTRVDVGHRHFERHGAGGASIRTAVEGSGGWSSLLELFAAKVHEA